MGITTNDGSVVLSGVCIINANDEMLLLRRRDHGHLETPGGKLEESDCDDEGKSGFTEDDLQRAAVREMFEELGQGFIVEEFESLGSTAFSLPDGDAAVAYKFFTRLLFGTPVLQESETFSGFEWVPVDGLEKRDDLSPDLSHFIKSVRAHLETE